MILQAIDTGTYRPGDRLVESELAERFGVSRTPIREALQRLETQSLLSRDGRSLLVASLDHNEMADDQIVPGQEIVVPAHLLRPVFRAALPPAEPSPIPTAAASMMVMK